MSMDALCTVFVVSLPLNAKGADVLELFRQYEPVSASLVDDRELLNLQDSAPSGVRRQGAIVRFQTVIEAKMAALRLDRYVVNVQLQESTIECWHGCTNFNTAPCICDDIQLEQVRGARRAVGAADAVDRPAT